MDPFLSEDSADLGDRVTDAVVRVIDEGGVGSLTVSAVARRLDVTPQAVTQRLGGPSGARRRVLQLATVGFRFRWEAWIDDALLAPVPLPALPQDAAELRGVRVWLGLHQLARAEEGRGNEDVGGALAGARSFERIGTHRQLERWAAARLPDEPVDRILALADGLRFGLAVPSPWSTDARRRACFSPSSNGSGASTPARLPRPPRRPPNFLTRKQPPPCLRVRKFAPPTLVTVRIGRSLTCHGG